MGRKSKTMKFKGTLIVVKDCHKALKFYQDMFGFELLRDNDGNMELSSQRPKNQPLPFLHPKTAGPL